jgi:hypothetical protein
MRGRLVFVVTVLSFGLFLSNCDNGDGDEDPAPTLAGTYVFTEAILVTEVKYEDTSIPANTDLTDVMVGSLLLESPCQNQAATAVDLRENGELWFICTDNSGDPEYAGTWDENSTLTELTLVTSIQGQSVTLDVFNVSKPAAVISGTLVFPFIGELYVAAYEKVNGQGSWPAALDPPPFTEVISNPDILGSLAIKFTEVQ